MKAILITVAMLAAVALTPARTGAAETTRSTGMLLQDCQAGGARWDICKSYISGALEMASAASAASMLQSATVKPVFCMPENIAPPIAAALFVQWAGRNSDRWREHRVIGVILAFQEAWPCE